MNKEIKKVLQITTLILFCFFMIVKNDQIRCSQKPKCLEKARRIVIEEKNIKVQNKIEVKIDEQEVVEKKMYDYTEEEVDLLARVMYAEVGVYLSTLSEEDARRAHFLTGSVVLNRVNVKLGGAKTIEEVIYYDGQYQCVDNGTINNEPPEIVYEWARYLLENGPEGPPDMIYQATFKQGTSVYDQISNTYFCCKEGIDDL